MAYLWLILAGLAVLLIVGGVVLWWQARARLVQIQRQLAWSEASRFALELHAEKVDARLDALSAVLGAQQESIDAADRETRRRIIANAEEEARRRAVADALHTRAAVGGPPEWADTEPYVDRSDGFKRTRPATLAR